MFSNKRNTPQTIPVDKSTIGTVIGRGISLEGGTLSGDGNVRIDGKFIGQIAVNGHIVISDSGTVCGDICTFSALLAGAFEGNIKAEDSVHLASTAVIDGNIHCKTIIIDEDATFNGNCVMGAAGAPAMLEAARSIEDDEDVADSITA